MELTLNLGWLLVALWMVFAWLRMTPRTVVDRRFQMVALAMVILILLPAISMTDDLVAAHNPAEIDCCVRRIHDQNSSSLHSITPAASSLPLPAFAGVSFTLKRLTALGHLSSPVIDHPALAPIENRPPPAA